MKPFVVYSTKTGNTKKVADVIAEVLGVEAKNVNDVKTIPECSILVAGSGVYSSKPGKGMTSFLENIPKGKCKKAAVFETSGDGKKVVAGEQMAWWLEKKGVKVTDKFVCPGKTFYVVQRGRPSAEDLSNARKFAEGLK